MEEIDVRHIHILEFPKQLLWTDRDLEYFLEEMPSEALRMNNHVYDAFIKEVDDALTSSPEEAFNLAYYECVRISLAKYPESRDLFTMFEMDIQHNQSCVNYLYTDVIMNMVWAMLYSTNTARRFTDKLHSYLLNSKRLRYSFKEFFTPNDRMHMVFPYKEIEEPKYNVKFTPFPIEANYNSTHNLWDKLTIGYKGHLIEELLMLWPKEKRDYILQCIMKEKDAQTKNIADNIKNLPVCKDADDGEIVEKQQLCKERDEWKTKYAELEEELQARTDEVEKWHNLYEEETKRIIMEKAHGEELDDLKKRCKDLENKKDPENAFNVQTGKPCFTSKQMCLFLRAVAELTEQPNPPAKSTLGEVVEKIGGYAKSAATTNLKQSPNDTDKEIVAKAIESKFPKLAAKVRRL